MKHIVSVTELTHLTLIYRHARVDFHHIHTAVTDADIHAHVCDLNFIHLYIIYRYYIKFFCPTQCILKRLNK